MGQIPLLHRFVVFQSFSCEISKRVADKHLYAAKIVCEWLNQVQFHYRRQFCTKLKTTNFCNVTQIFFRAWTRLARNAFVTNLSKWSILKPVLCKQSHWTLPLESVAGGEWWFELRTFGLYDEDFNRCFLYVQDASKLCSSTIPTRDKPWLPLWGKLHSQQLSASNKL